MPQETAPAARPAAPARPLTLRDLREAAIAHHHKGELEEAKAAYRLFLSREPRDGAIWTNLGALHRKQQDYAAAVACQRRAVELGPGRTDFLNNLANALYDNGDLEESLALRRRVAEMEAGKAGPLQYVATSLRSLNRFAEAVAVCNEGIALDPTINELTLQKSMAELALMDYPAGFRNFEARWQGDEISKPAMKEPEWDGSDPTGVSMLVMPEQGFGDTVLMARFLPALSALGAQVHLAVKTPLLRLFRDLPGVLQLHEIGGPKPRIDAWVSMMSLPRHLGLTKETVPAPARLSVPRDAVERARTLVEPHRKRLKVGILWSGSVTYRANHKRSFAMERFYPLAGIPGVTLFSLYKGPLLDAFRTSGLASVAIDAGGHDRDFADTAALMRELDLVVSMDSAVVHIAGSLGVPVWNLLHFSAYWLYGAEGSETPWYPSMRLIRQPKLDDWDAVFDIVARDLAALAAHRAGGA